MYFLLAVRRSNVATVKELIGILGKTNLDELSKKHDKHDRHALALAAIANNVEMLEYLHKELGYKINYCNKKNQSALYFALKRNKYESCQYLWLNDADFNFTLKNLDKKNSKFIAELYPINSLITSLVYELKRHNWEHEQCQKLKKELLKFNLPIKLKNFLDNKNNHELSKYIELQEMQLGDYFGKYISDDSDSENEQIYQIKNKVNVYIILYNILNFSHVYYKYTNIITKNYICIL